MPPKFLRRIQLKHCARLRALALRKSSFVVDVVNNEGDVSIVDDSKACWLCGDCDNIPDQNNVVVAINHLDHKSKCKCRAHPSCIHKWQSLHEGKGVRIRICPMCRGKRAEWQPKKTFVKCHAPLLNGGVCQKRNGHADDPFHWFV